MVPVENEFSDEDIDAMANEFANVEIGRRPVVASPIEVSRPLQAKRAIPSSGSSKSSPKPPTSTTISSKPTKQSKAFEADDPSTEYFEYHKCPKPPSLVYTTDPSEANDLISCLKGDVFGFDLEWPSGIKTWDQTTKRYTFGQGRTALVQICDKETIILIHLKRSTRMLCHVMSSLVEVVLMLSFTRESDGSGTRSCKIQTGSSDTR